MKANLRLFTHQGFLVIGRFHQSGFEGRIGRVRERCSDIPPQPPPLRPLHRTPHDIAADKLKATMAPMFFIHGDADGIRLEHVAEMFRLKGGGTHGDMGPRTASRLAVLPDTTHVTLMQSMAVIVPMTEDFPDAKP